MHNAQQEEAEWERLALDSLFINVVAKWFGVKTAKTSADYADDIRKSPRAYCRG